MDETQESKQELPQEKMRERMMTGDDVDAQSDTSTTSFANSEAGSRGPATNGPAEEGPIQSLDSTFMTPRPPGPTPSHQRPSQPTLRPLHSTTLNGSTWPYR